jgi:hypothetical protein
MNRPTAFTDRYLASLKPAAGRYDVLDQTRRGLMLRVFPTGTKTFNFRYKRNGVAVRIAIGNYPEFSLRQAYEAHAELTRRLNRGEDLRGLDGSVINPEAVPSSRGPTVADIADEFVRRYIQRERKQPEDARRIIENNILKDWRHRPAKSLTRREGLLLDKIVDRGAPVMANRVAAILTQMFNFALERGLIEATPFTSLPRPGGTEKSRKRKLDDREVYVFWKKLTSSRLNFETRTALKLILVTAQRPGEVALAARWEFDLERRIWTIPAERSKVCTPVTPLHEMTVA